MKTFEFCFYRAATQEERRNNNFGPILERVRMDGHTKASAVKSAKNHARMMGWRFLADETMEIKGTLQGGKGEGNEPDR